MFFGEPAKSEGRSLKRAAKRSVNFSAVYSSDAFRSEENILG
jgi:hypothetical protein